MALLERAVSRWKREKFLAGLSELFVKISAAASVLFFSGLLVDRWGGLSAAFRRGYWIFSLASLIFIFWKWGLKPWMRFSTLEMMEEAEKRFPFLRLRLKSAWELSGKTPSFSSPDLTAAHIKEAEEALAQPKIPSLIDFSFLRLFRLSLAAVLFILLILSARRREFFTRLVWPWNNETLERLVTIDPGDGVVDWGNPIQIRAFWKPQSVIARGFKELKIELLLSSGWQERSWDFLTPLQATLKFPAVNSRVQYRLSWKDLRSRSYLISPVLIPRLLSLRFRERRVDPDWSDLSAGSSTFVLAGHILSVRGDPNQDLKSAFLKVSTLPREIPMRKINSGEYAASFFISRDSAIGFDLKSQDGRKSGGAQKYFIKVKPDEPPTIQILYPLSSVEGSLQDSLPISYLAEDDGGLTKISWIATAPSGKTQESVIESSDHPHELYGDYSLKLSLLPLGVSLLKLKAEDSAHPSQSGFSSSLAIKVIDFEARRAAASVAWKKVEEKLAQWKEAEKNALAALNGMDPQKISEAQKNAESSERKSIEAMAGLERALARDPYVNPALSQAISALKDQLARQGASRLEAAKAASRSGHPDLARQNHRELLRAARRAKRFLSEARKTQGLEDSIFSSKSMADSALSLASQLSQLAGGKANSKAGKEALNKSLSALQSAMKKMSDAIKNLPISKSGNATQATPLSFQEAQESLNALQKAISSGDYSKAAQIAQNLASQMNQMSSALSAMARNSAFSEALREMVQNLTSARRALSQAIDQENALSEKTRALENERLKKELSDQKEFLKKLSALQAVVISSAALHGAEFPSDILSRMRSVKAQFDSGSAGHARSALARISGALRARDSFEPRPFWKDYALKEDHIRRLLDQGTPPPKADLAKSRHLSSQQILARQTAALARQQLAKLQFSMPQFPGQSLQNIDQAVTDERAAQSALGDAQSQGALLKEGEALSHLNQGLGSLDQSLRSQGSLESALTGGFENSFSTLRIFDGAPGQGLGARVGLVPLPPAQKYQPLKKLRHEIERSLNQPVPNGYQKMIKTYLRSIAQ